MTIEKIKELLDACYQAKSARIAAGTSKGVTSSYIHYLDTIEHLEQRGIRVKVSDISDALNIPRPGVTRTVKEMEKAVIFAKIPQTQMDVLHILRLPMKAGCFPGRITSSFCTAYSTFSRDIGWGCRLHDPYHRETLSDHVRKENFT